MNPFKHSGHSLFKSIEKYFIHHKKYVFSTAINLTILFIISLALQYTGLFEVQRFIDLSLFAWTAIALDVIALRLYQHTSKSATLGALFRYIFVMLLIIQSIKGIYSIEIIDALNNIPLFLAIAFGALILYDERQQFSETKENNFEKSHPKINSIPVLSYISKKIYLEDKWHTCAIILIFAVFAIIKFSVPYFYTGSYIDEYSHIFSGIEYFESGHFAEIHRGSYYMRGAYTSFSVGLLMNIFGQNLYVAKMLPALIGIINFILLYSIAKKMIKRKTYILLLMSIYTICPWFIFNHFYIRHYVFYEFFLLASTFLFLKLAKSISNNNIKKIIIYSIILATINSINYFLSNDLGQYMILFANLILFCYILLFELHKIELPKNNILLRQINKILKLNLSVKLLILAYVLVYFLFTVDISDKIHRLTVGVLSFSNPEEYKYDNLFFNLNPTYMAFFILSSIMLLKKKITEHHAVILISLALFSAHMVSSSSLQVTRAIIYFLPLFYLVSILTLSRFRLNKLLTIIVVSLLLINIYSNYPDDFITGPRIPYEGNYLEYQNIYSFIKNNCNDGLKINLLHRPDISFFYNTETDFIPYIKSALLKKDIKYYYNSSSNKYYTVQENIEVITTMDELIKIHNSPIKKCYILPRNNKHIWRYSAFQFADEIRNNYTIKKQFDEIDVIILQ